MIRKGEAPAVPREKMDIEPNGSARASPSIRVPLGDWHSSGASRFGWETNGTNFFLPKAKRLPMNASEDLSRSANHGVDRVLLSIDVQIHCIGVSAGIIIGFEHGNFVIVVQPIRRNKSRNPRSDNRQFQRRYLMQKNMRHVLFAEIVFAQVGVAAVDPTA